MRKTLGYCAGCGSVLGWIGSRKGPLYCREKCGSGGCSCAAGHYPVPEVREEELRDVYRVA